MKSLLRRIGNENLAAPWLAVILVVLIVAATYAQEPAAAPKSGPKQERLGYYVGKWTEEGEIKPSAFGPGGKYTATETCDWLQGKFAILCKEDATMVGGETHSHQHHDLQHAGEVLCVFRDQQLG